MKVLSWNVNGLRAAYRKGLLEWFEEEKPDMLCLQEVRALEEQLPSELREIEGYHAYFCPAEKKGYSGVAIYSKMKPQSVKNGFGIERFDSEGRTIIADYGDFALFSVYFPNGTSSDERLQYKLEFYDALLDYVKDMNKEGKRVIICGDVNAAHKEIDLAQPEEKKTVSGFLPEERAWIDRLLNAGYIDTFRMFNQEPGHYTWWKFGQNTRKRNLGWRLDYFFVCEELRDSVKSAFILSDVMGSDHCPVGIVLDV